MVKARMRCTSVTDFGNCKNVRLDAVYSDDPNDPNYTFSQASPSGSFELSISNPAAFAAFEPGKTYDIDISAID